MKLNRKFVELIVENFLRHGEPIVKSRGYCKLEIYYRHHEHSEVIQEKTCKGTKCFDVLQSI